MSDYVNKVIALYTSSDTNPSPERFHQWLTDNHFEAEKAEALLRLWNQASNIPAESTLAALMSLNLKSQLNTRRTIGRPAVWRYAAAIALCLSLAAAYIFTQQSSPAPLFVEYFTGSGQTETLELPDGSIVQTNSATLIVYPDNFGKDTRTLYLSGEANFKVVKNPDAPFVVKSKYTEVVALGTEFTVSSYAEDKDVKVTLISGRIKVEATDNRTDFILEQAGEQFVYNKQQKQYAINQVDLYDATAWQRSELVFRGMTIPDILTVLERRYAVSFQYNFSSINDDKFNFYFKKETSLVDIMDIIKTVAGTFDYTITNRF
ncbi:MAG: FecR domain-containing protein [Prevotellaceae bacterium]|jgi:ferric-dicitrate binding protein FerR (iron transport regulator)|nr:FecR domain-containing protein [Prevotellaceae bacterium]